MPGGKYTQITCSDVADGSHVANYKRVDGPNASTTLNVVEAPDGSTSLSFGLSLQDQSGKISKVGPVQGKMDDPLRPKDEIEEMAVQTKKACNTVSGTKFKVPTP